MLTFRISRTGRRRGRHSVASWRPRYASIALSRRRDLLVGALGDLPPVVAGDHPVGHALDDAHVVLVQDGEFQLVAHPHDVIAQLEGLAGVHPGGRLVETGPRARSRSPGPSPTDGGSRTTARTPADPSVASQPRPKKPSASFARSRICSSSRRLLGELQDRAKHSAFRSGSAVQPSRSRAPSCSGTTGRSGTFARCLAPGWRSDGADRRRCLRTGCRRHPADEPGHDVEERALARPVRPDHAHDLAHVTFRSRLPIAWTPPKDFTTPSTSMSGLTAGPLRRGRGRASASASACSFWAKISCQASCFGSSSCSSRERRTLGSALRPQEHDREERPAVDQQAVLLELRQQLGEPEQHERADDHTRDAAQPAEDDDDQDRDRDDHP